MYVCIYSDLILMTVMMLIITMMMMVSYNKRNVYNIL